MAAQPGTLEILAREIGFALAPMATRLESGKVLGLLADVGYIPQGALLQSASAAVTNARTKAEGLQPKLAALAAAIQQGNATQIASQGIAIVQQIGSLIDALTSLGQQLKSAAPSDAELIEFTQAMPRRLVDLMVVEYLESRTPTVTNALEVLGIVERTFVEPPAQSTPARIGYIAKRFYPERATTLLGSPTNYLKQRFDWGNPAFSQAPYTKSVSLLEYLRKAAVTAFPYTFPQLINDGVKPPLLDIQIATLEVTPAGLELEFLEGIEEAWSDEWELKTPWKIFAAGDLTFSTGVEFALAPPLNVTVQPNVVAGAKLATGLKRDAAAGPMVLLGQAGGSRLEIAAPLVQAAIALAFDAQSSKLKGEPSIDAQLKGGKLVIDTSSASGLVKPLLSSLKIESDFSLELAWRLSTGLKFKGAAALEMRFPTKVTVGPLTIQSAFVKAALLPGGAIGTEISGGFLVAMGPVEVTVDRMGLETNISFPQGGNGNVGPAQVDLAFKAPSGLGIRIEASVVTGGGFVARDAGPPERFSGALSLKLTKISISAFGILERTASGRVSFVIVIGIRFTPGIQIGWGISLTGVGGVVGINRRADADALRERLTSGAAGNVLFATDPVKNAPALLGDLNAILPAADGIFIVGPTVQLTWLEIAQFDLGILIELPGPSKIILLGSARVQFGGQAGTPALVNIRLDIFGCIDFVQKLIAFDAALINSKVFQVFQLTGEALFRLSYGDKPYLVLSIGGFHPSFNPEPANLPKISRVAVTYESWGAISYRVRLDAYFAITSNTLQVGAKLEASITAGPLNAMGFIGFDALIQFKPFYFQVDFAAGFRIRFESFTLASVRFAGRLSGPGPVVLAGSFTFEILFFSVTWEDSIAIGSKTPQPIQPVSDLVQALAPELAQISNLETVSGEDKETVLGSMKAAGKAVVVPKGQLVWRQKRSPLNVTVERFQSVPLAKPQAAIVATTTTAVASKDWFSPGTFIELSQSESLNKAPFDRLEAGLQLGFTDKKATEKPYPVQVNTIRLPYPPILTAYVIFPEVLMSLATTGVAPPVLKVKDEAWSAGNLGGLTQTDAHQRAKMSVGQIVALPAADAGDPINLGAI